MERFYKKGWLSRGNVSSRLTSQCPSAVEKFWVEIGSGLDTIEYNISVMSKAGYRFIAAFTLPEKCWTEKCFVPRAAAEKPSVEKCNGNQTVKAYIAQGKYEIELYTKFKQYYGYVFYIGKKCRQ